jgi:hypothetical protein
MFFHGAYKSLLEMNESMIIVNSIISGFMQFTIQWVFIGIILYLFLNFLGGSRFGKIYLPFQDLCSQLSFYTEFNSHGVVLAYPEMHLSLKTLGGVSGMDSGCTEFHVYNNHQI